MESYNICGGRALGIAFGITMLVLLSAGGAGAVTEINSCTTISSPGEYLLSASITDSSATSCINITSSNVTFDGAGYTIDGKGATGTYGVSVYDPAGAGLTNVNVKNLKLTDWYYGIYYNGYFDTVNGSITNNIINSSNSGIVLYYTRNYTITNNSAGGIELDYSVNNIIADNNAGVFFHHSHGNTITDNNASSKGGIVLNYAIDNIVTGNDVSSNYYGISMSYASGNIIANNRATGSTDAGIVFGPVTDNNTITNNDISSNKYGISSYYATNNTVASNTINSNSDYGIYLTSSGNNTIYNNHFNNKNNAYDDGNNTWNVTKTPGTNIIGGVWLGGNFWSDYAGKDTDGDGLGNTLLPYISSGNITNGGDFLPLTAALAPTATPTVTPTITPTATPTVTPTVTPTITPAIPQVAGSISGFNLIDDGSGIQDMSATGLSGWRIELKSNRMENRHIIRRETFTDNSGFYKFDNLPAGRYTVTEKLQKGFVPASPLSRVIILAEGENSMNNNFTNRPINSRFASPET